MSQLFQWRKELCQIEEPRPETASTLVPVIVLETAPAIQPIATETPAPPQPRRKRSDVTIELGRGRRVRVDSDIDTRSVAFSVVCWVGDDPGPCWCEGLVGNRPYGHAQRLAGLSLVLEETLKRDPMCGNLFVFRGRWRPDQGDLA